MTRISRTNLKPYNTPKYHRNNRPLQLTQEDVKRLLKLKSAQGAKDSDWIFPNERKSGPICHEQILGKNGDVSA